MSFAQQLDAQVKRLGTAQTCAVLGRKRRTLETWRAGKEPDGLVQRGVLAILAETKPIPASPAKSNRIKPRSREV